MSIYTELDPYVPVGFGTVTANLTARNMTTMQQQHDPCALAAINNHTHDDIYYEQMITDSIYYKSGVMAGDADLVDGQTFAQLVASMLPIGIGFFWRSSYGNVPANWHLADGSTQGGRVLPDARGLFIRCASPTYPARGTSGSATVTVGGTVYVSSYTLLTSDIPYHYHNWSDGAATASISIEAAYMVSGAFYTTGTSQNETTDNGHPGVADAAHGAENLGINFVAFQNTPLWWCEQLIFKVS